MATASAPSRGSALSRFAHFAGLSKARADDSPATTDDVAEVEDKIEGQQEDLDEAQDDVEAVKKRLDELEDRVDQVEDRQEDDEEDDAGDDAAADPDEPPAEKPAERAAYRKGMKNGRKAERVRAGAILETKAAAANPALAMHLAFDTSIEPKAALATMKAAQAGAPRAAAEPAKAGLDARMGGSRRIAVGSGGAGGPDLNTHAGMASRAVELARRAGLVK